MLGKTEIGGPDAGARDRAGAVPGVGVAPYIMTPTNAIDGESGSVEPRVLAFGVDSIWLNCYGDLPEHLLLCLEMAKENAQESPIREDLSPLPPFLGTNLLMQPKGLRHYDFLAQSDDLSVQLKGPKGLRLPTVVLRLSSACLWRLGGGGWPAIDAAVSWAREVFPSGVEVRVSHFHQCGDVQGWLPSLGDLGGIVKRADDLDIFHDGGEKFEEEGLRYRLAKGDALQGVAAGRSNRLRASVYDKSKEIRRSGKEWFRDVWAQHASYNPDLPTWRVEYMYGREFLHKHRIESVEDLRLHQDALWRYGLAWFSWRERQASDLAHPQRWPVVAAWAALVAARPFSAALPVARLVRPKLLKLAQGAYGYLSTIMAITDETDEEAALGRLLAIVRVDKGASRMREVLVKKKQRYASVARADATGLERLREVAASRRAGGEGVGAVHDRWRKWGDGFIGSRNRDAGVRR